MVVLSNTSLSGTFLVNCKHLITLLLLAFLSLNTAAVQLNGLYNASVEVPSQTTVDRSKGFQEALEKVLIRVTGDELLLHGKSVKKLLKSSENYVLSFGYRENPDYLAYLEDIEHRNAITTNAEEDKLDSNPENYNDVPSLEGIQAVEDGLIKPLVEPSQFLLDVVFAESALKARLQSLSLPVWGKTRPSVLVWVVKSDSQGERSIIGASDVAQYLPGLIAEAAERGVPIYLPVADLTDLSLLDVDGLWGLFSDSHIEASRRYNADSVAILRLHNMDDESVTLNSQKAGSSLEQKLNADWQLFLGEQTFPQEYNDSLAGLSANFISTLARIISSQYAISGAHESDLFSIEVVGVNNFSDYAAVQRYLADLAPVASVEMVAAESDRLSFELTLRDTRDMFYQHLSLGRKMIKLDEQISSLPASNILIEPAQKFVWQSGN